MSTSPRGATPFPDDMLIGESAAFLDALDRARQAVAENALIVLLTGEAGTGKELIARAMHAAGETRRAPFFVAGCSSIPQPLLEAELFGAERGVFASASAGKPGLLELASAGTLFLTDPADLPLWLQPSLLRALQERSVRRIGGTSEVAMECRFVLAANAPLEGMVEGGTLRSDLGEVLRTCEIRVPALRDREHDVVLLAEHFLEVWARGRGLAAKQLEASASQALVRHHWPGNVRELRYMIEQAAALVQEERITSGHLTIRHRLARSGASHGQESVAEIPIPISGRRLDDIEREAILLTLQLARGNQSAAARMLGISRPTLARKLQQYGVRAR